MIATVVAAAIVMPKVIKSGAKKLKGVKLGRGSGCSSFVAGTLVLVASATGHAAVPIEDVALGQRVLPDDASCQALDVDDWVQVDVVMRGGDDHPDDVYSISLLRPLSWIEREGVLEGRAVFLDFEELNLDGWALVLKIRDGPGDAGGPGCPVTATIRHTGYDFVELGVAGGEPLVLTSTHRIFSATRGDWVEAWEVRAGEVLSTERGTAGVAWVEHGGRAAEAVYNLEVASVHRYFAGDASVLAHNACPGVVAMDNNALVNAIEGDGAAARALRGRAPVVSPQSAREFLKGSAAQRAALGNAGARRANAKTLRQFLRDRGGRLGAPSDASGRAAAEAAGARRTARNIRQGSAGDPAVVDSAVKEGIPLMTRDANLLEKFSFTEPF